jgi:hypothetical protein
MLNGVILIIINYSWEFMLLMKMRCWRSPVKVHQCFGGTHVSILRVKSKPSKQLVHPKHQWTSTRLHGVTSHKICTLYCHICNCSGGNPRVMSSCVWYLFIVTFGCCVYGVEHWPCWVCCILTFPALCWAVLEQLWRWRRWLWKCPVHLSGKPFC